MLNPGENLEWFREFRPNEVPMIKIMLYEAVSVIYSSKQLLVNMFLAQSLLYCLKKRTISRSKNPDYNAYKKPDS